MHIPMYHVTLTESNGLTIEQVTKIKSIFEKGFRNYDVVMEYGSSGTNRHIHAIFDSPRRTDKIRDTFKRVYATPPPGKTREFFFNRIKLCKNKKTLAETFVYHRKEIDEHTPYLYDDGSKSPINKESKIILTTFTEQEIENQIVTYKPLTYRVLPKRVIAMTISKNDLIHTLDAYATQVFPEHNEPLTHNEYTVMIARMVQEGYVLYYHMKPNIYHWLNVFRGSKDSMRQLVREEL